jgi:diguanylate cyclase (GGDEF)-like protein
LRVWDQAKLKSLVVPGGLLFLCVALLAYSGWLTLAVPALSFLYYCAVGGGMLMAWRFHSSRIFLSLLVLFLGQQAVGLFAGQAHLVSMTVQAVAVLVPLDFVLIAVMHERGFTAASILPVAMLLFVESVPIAVFTSAASGEKPSPVPLHHLATMPLPRYALTVLVLAGIFLIARFLITRKPSDSALLWSLCSFAAALHFTGTPRVSVLYWAAAACILAVSIVENSYLLAYHDELTSLPSRRAFNNAMMRLQSPYSIAVVDIDHFKKFNDTYGHETGDQVLRLVASNLARVTGGGQAYRCGGEEFTILFSGKTTVEVTGHLEDLRKAIESSEFRMRGGDRRKVPRGPERRIPGSRARVSKGQAIRQLAEDKPSAVLSVTVSMGVATSGKEPSDPDLILQAADKALYRAKANGRNRLETASSVRSGRAKKAGIA